ncbi:MAG: endolytic transglycosylase MltG, partial [Limnochordia bacterium]
MRPKLSAKTKRTVLLVVRFVLVTAVVLLMVGQVALAVVVLLAHQPASRRDSLDRIVEIPLGTPAGRISRMLEEQGLIRSAFIFDIMLKITNRDSQLKAGEYLLNPAMNTMEVIQKLNEGTIVTHRIMIPEGYELKQIAAVLAREGLVDPERFLMLAQNAELVFGEQFPVELPIPSLEGYLFPDTYHFAKEQSEEAIIRQMVSRFVDVVISKVDLSLLDDKYTLHEVITLAS